MILQPTDESMTVRAREGKYELLKSHRAARSTRQAESDPAMAARKKDEERRRRRVRRNTEMLTRLPMMPV